MALYNKKFNIKYKSEIGAYIVYYELVSILYRLPVTPKEILFLAHVAYKGNTYSPKVRDSFIKEHGVSAAQVYNMISELKKYKLLVKEGSKISINTGLIIPKTDSLTRVSLNIDLNIGN